MNQIILSKKYFLQSKTRNEDQNNEHKEMEEEKSHHKKTKNIRKHKKISEEDIDAKNPYLSSSSQSNSEDESIEENKKEKKSHSRSRSRSNSKERHKEKIYTKQNIKESIRHSAKMQRKNSEENTITKERKRSNESSESHEYSKIKPKIVWPNLDYPLVTLKKFMEIQKDYIKVDEAEKLYNQYKKDHENKQNEEFVKEHRKEFWFREKYHPIEVFQWRIEKCNNIRNLAYKFFADLKAGKYAGLKLEGKYSEENIAKAPYFGFDINSMTLYLNSIPPIISRSELLKVVQKTPGFIGLSLSEPLKSQKFIRYGWISYDSDENCNRSKEILEGISLGDFKFNPIKSYSSKKPIKVIYFQYFSYKITPALPENCEKLDLDFSKKLILLLDEERGIKARFISLIK